MAELPALAPAAFKLLQLPRDVQLLILLAFNIRELIICKGVGLPLDQYFIKPNADIFRFSDVPLRSFSVGEIHPYVQGCILALEMYPLQRL